MLHKDDIKAIVDAVSPLIDARAKTTETVIKAEINGVKKELRAELASKADVKKIDDGLVEMKPKIDRMADDHEKRIKDLEEHTGIHSHKN